MEPVGATTVFLFALLTAVATGLGAVPFAFAKHPTRRLLGVSNAVAAGLMLAASFGLIYEGMNYGPLRALAGALLGLAFIVVARRSLRQEEHPAVFASMSGLDARKALLIVGVMTIHSFTEGVGIGVSFGGDQALGLFISLALAVHNVPEGLAISLVLVPRGVGWVRAAFALRIGLRGGGHDLDGLLRARARRQRGSFEQPRGGGDHGLSRRYGGFSGPHPVDTS
jgi:ZIP family zinc transporter